ncbi:MAG: hypothetical protein WBG48_15800, partial [Pricia sp.]
GSVVDFIIYDKSGYVLKSGEIAKDIGILQNPGLFASGYTQMYLHGGQLKRELQRCIGEAFQDTYRKSRRSVLLSEHIQKAGIKAVVAEMARSERFAFLKSYMHTDNRNLADLIRAQFDKVKEELYIKETVKEDGQLRTKAELIKNIIDKQLFGISNPKNVLFKLCRSLGTRYFRGDLNFANSYRHKVKLHLGHVPRPDRTEFHASPHFIFENEKMLDGLINERTEKEIHPSPTAMFLPLMFPNVYGAMAPKYRERFQLLSLRPYYKYAERMQMSFEKSPKDYIQFFNAKGFYFTRRMEKIHIGSIYTEHSVGVPLAPKTQAYLESSGNLDIIIDNQTTLLRDIENYGRANLKSLWASHLLERGQYKKAAYLYVLEGVRPNLPVEILQHHMEKGFKEALVHVSRKRMDAKQARLVRNAIYSIGNMIGNRSPKGEEAFNGFRDKLTDWSKYRKKSRGFSL